jgi:hypothetical protein
VSTTKLSQTVFVRHARFGNCPKLSLCDMPASEYVLDQAHDSDDDDSSEEDEEPVSDLIEDSDSDGEDDGQRHKDADDRDAFQSSEEEEDNRMIRALLRRQAYGERLEKEAEKQGQDTKRANRQKRVLEDDDIEDSMPRVQQERVPRLNPADVEMNCVAPETSDDVEMSEEYEFAHVIDLPEFADPAVNNADSQVIAARLEYPWTVICTPLVYKMTRVPEHFTVLSHEFSVQAALALPMAIDAAVLIKAVLDVCSQNQPPDQLKRALQRSCLPNSGLYLDLAISIHRTLLSEDLRAKYTNGQMPVMSPTNDFMETACGVNWR